MAKNTHFFNTLPRISAKAIFWVFSHRLDFHRLPLISFGKNSWASPFLFGASLKDENGIIGCHNFIGIYSKIFRSIEDDFLPQNGEKHSLFSHSAPFISEVYFLGFCTQVSF